MPFETLTDFIANREDAGDLLRISNEVSSQFEIAEITRQVSARPNGGPAIFFENVVGHSVPIVSNLLGSEERVTRIFGTNRLDEAPKSLIQKLIPQYPGNWLEAVQMIPKLSELQKIPPQIVSRAACQQVVRLGRDVNLSEFPIPHHWPAESAPTLTRAIVVGINQNDGRRIVSSESVNLIDHDRLVIHWDNHSPFSQLWKESEQLQRQVPVAVILGGDPILEVISKARLPLTVDAYLLAGLLRDKPLPLISCRSQPVDVPANAEFIFEGVLNPDSHLVESGPLVMPSGHLSQSFLRPVMNVTAITHRINPVMPTEVFAQTHMENGYIGKQLERFYLSIVRLHQPEILDVHCPVHSDSRNVLFVRINKSYPHHAQKVIYALWGFGGPFASKMIVVVDSDVNLRDSEQIWKTIAEAVHPDRDVTLTNGPAEMTEIASPIVGTMGRMGIDATRKLPEEGHPQNWPQMAGVPDAIQLKVEQMLRTLRD